MDRKYVLVEDALYFNKRFVVLLYKQFLNILEDFKRERDINYSKMLKSIPEEYHCLIEMGNYFDDQRFVAARKKTLDYGNDAIRNFEQDINNLS